MTAAELTKLHELYRHAGEQARDESLTEETREKALADVVDLRVKLDEAIIEAQREREVDQARASMEFQMREAPNPLLQAIKDWASPPTQDGPKTRALEIPLVRANEEWFKDVGSTVKAGYTYTSELMTNLICMRPLKKPHRLPGAAFSCSASAAAPNQRAAFSLATSALITSNSFSSLPAMPTSVMYLPLTTTAGVPVIL